jgi:hypothetical protein
MAPEVTRMLAAAGRLPQSPHRLYHQELHVTGFLLSIYF